MADGCATSFARLFWEGRIDFLESIDLPGRNDGDARRWPRSPASAASFCCSVRTCRCTLGKGAYAPTGSGRSTQREAAAA